MASEAVHIGKDTAARALVELQQRGFLKATKRGAFSLKTRHASEWMLTAHVSDISSHAATKDYEQWQPPQIQTTVPVVRPCVPVVRPNGPCGATDARKKGSKHRLTVPAVRL